jgi:hypothetical protein
LAGDYHSIVINRVMEAGRETTKEGNSITEENEGPTDKLEWLSPFGDALDGNMLGTPSFPALHLPLDSTILPKQSNNDTYNCAFGVIATLAMVLRDLIVDDAMFDDQFSATALELKKCALTDKMYCKMPYSDLQPPWVSLPKVKRESFLPELQEQWFVLFNRLTKLQSDVEPKKVFADYLVPDVYTKNLTPMWVNCYYYSFRLHNWNLGYQSDFWKANPQGSLRKLSKTKKQSEGTATRESPFNFNKSVWSLPRGRRRLLAHIRVLMSKSRLWKECQKQQTLTIASEGGFKGRKCTFGWLISTKSRSVLAEGAGPVDGPFDTANLTRCELGGLTAPLIFLSLLHSLWGKQHKCTTFTGITCANTFNRANDGPIKCGTVLILKHLGA